MSAAGQVGLVVGVGPDRQDRAEVDADGHGVGSSVSVPPECRPDQHPIALPRGADTRRHRAPAAVERDARRWRGSSRTMTTTIRTTTRPTARLTSCPTDLLERFRARAGELDRTNTYFDDDLAELQALRLPRRRGARPRSAAGATTSPSWPRSQRRLARYAPATALATDACTSTGSGIAAEFERAGDDLAALDLRARPWPATCSPPATPRPATTSRCCCRPARPSGSRAATASPAASSSARTGRSWSWLGAHAIDADAAGGPQIVHAFVERTSPGVTVVETWDTLGMRPTQSHDTILDGVFVPDARIGRVVPAGDDSDLFIVGDEHVAAARSSPSVYLGIAERALELAVASARKQDVDRHPAGGLRVQPDGAAPDRRDVPRARRRQATVDRFVDDWVAGRRPRRGVGAQAVLDEVAGRRSRQAGRGHRPRRRRRRRHVQGQRARAPLPGRPLRRVPPGQRRPHPRAGRQGVLGILAEQPRW